MEEAIRAGDASALAALLIDYQVCGYTCCSWSFGFGPAGNLMLRGNVTMQTALQDLSS
jgi:hypothetical protein